jgi:hypothetical protein
LRLHLLRLYVAHPPVPRMMYVALIALCVCLVTHGCFFTGAWSVFCGCVVCSVLQEKP